MKSGLDTFMDDVRRLIKTKPPYTASFTTQTLYLLNQAVTIMEGLQEIIKKQRIEEDRLRLLAEGKKRPKIKFDPYRTAKIIQAYKDGATPKQIGMIYGITAGRVCQILLRWGARDAGPSRTKGLPDPSDTEREGLDEGGEEARHPPDADRIGKDSDSGSDH